MNNIQEVSIPWGNWYLQGTKMLAFPAGWDVTLCKMEHSLALSERELISKIDLPIGAPNLDELARGKKSACIIIDDISRPTPGSFILPPIIKKLLGAGIPADKIKVLLALGGHRPMIRQDIEKKVGRYVFNTFEVLNHSPFRSDLVCVQDGEGKQIIKVNRTYAEADLKILVGCIVPHSLAGFSGGAKNVIPGVGGIETLEINHKLCFKNLEESMVQKTNYLNPDNPLRKNMEKIAGGFGIDFIVNVVLNDKMQVTDAFAGHYIEAHREACKRAAALYRTKLVPGADIVVLNAYPKDTEYNQVTSAFSVLGENKKLCFSENASLVLTTAASEGAGYHALFGPGMRLFTPQEENLPPSEISHIKTYIYSDGVNSNEIKQFFSKRFFPVHNEWEGVIEKLKADYKNPKVAVYPIASMQIGYIDSEEQ